MSYQEARKIRETTLKDLILKNVDRGQGAIGSVGSALAERFNLSKRFSAKVTGIKERLDPINIAKKLTGNVGAALVGRALGRSQEDIRYFSGKGKLGSYRGITQDNDLDNLLPAVYTKVSDGQRQRMKKGDSAADVLAKLYNLFKKSYENEEKRKEIDINFKYKEEKKKQERHEELLAAIARITGNAITSKAKKVKEPEKKEKGLFEGFGDLLKNIQKMITTAIDGLKVILQPLLDFAEIVGKNLLSTLGRFLVNPYVLAFLGVAAAGTLAVYLAGLMSDALTKLVKETVPNMAAISPEEAANILKSGSPRDIEALGGKEKLEDIVKNGKARAQELLKDPEKNKQAIIDAGGMDKLKKIAEGPDIEAPTRTDTQLPPAPPRPRAGVGVYKNVNENNPTPKLKLDQEKWDKNYAKDYNEDGSPKVTKAAKPLPSGVEESTAGAGQGSATAARMDPRRTDLVTPNAGVTTEGGAYVGGMHGAKRVPDSMSSSSPTSASESNTSVSGTTPVSPTTTPSEMSSSVPTTRPSEMSSSVPTATPTPPAPNPIAERMQSSIAENNNLQLENSKPNVITIDKSSKTVIPGGGSSNKVIMDNSVDVRIDDPTLLKAQRQSFRPV